MKRFEEATGITIKYTGSKNLKPPFASPSKVDLRRILPTSHKPGLLNSFVASGKVIDLNKVIDTAWLKKKLQTILAGYGDDERPEGADHGRCVEPSQW